MSKQTIIYRINKAVEQLGVSRATIYRLVKAGDLELVKLGARAAGVTGESLHAYVEKCKRAA